MPARARDDDGGTTISAASSITATAPSNQASAVSLTTPVNGATFTARQLTAVARDDASGMTGLEHHHDYGQRSGVAAMIEALSPGNYIATVTAFNDDGAARSAASTAFTR